MRETLEFFIMVGIIYFAITGTMTLVMGTTSFWMAVTSNSMMHADEGWREAYASRGFDTSKFPLQGGFERGDLLIVQGIRSASEISVGDVIIIDMGEGVIPLVHRVLEIWEENGELRFRTKGDANFSSLPGESSISPSQIIGRAIFAIPKIGHIFLLVQGK
ncbi:MAG: hypothetical protein QW567_04590 [Candidatus Hadarchaeales archaeon]